MHTYVHAAGVNGSNNQFIPSDDNEETLILRESRQLMFFNRLKSCLVKQRAGYLNCFDPCAVRPLFRHLSIGTVLLVPSP